jgi:hypothetical protein
VEEIDYKEQKLPNLSHTQMKKHLLLAIFLLFFVNLYSQNNEIIFKRYSVSESKGYKIEIREIDDKLIIQAILMDSISQNLKNDKEYKKLNKKLNKAARGEKINMELVKPILIKIEEIYDKHTYHKSDFIVLEKEQFPEYYNEFNEILNTPTSVLNKENRGRIVLNGHFITFIIKNYNYQNFFKLSSPDENSNPIIVKFMKSTFKVFRNENKNDFLDPKYTFGL